MKRFEAAIYLAAMAVLAGLLLLEGRRTTGLLAAQPIEPKALYKQLGNPQVKLQLVDLRPYDDDNYLDAHIPGAIPVPGCDLEKAPEKARDRVYPYVQTVLVTASGDTEGLAACQAKFAQARVLAGGQEAWSEANLPEEDTEYAPPKASAGGGCL